MARTHKSYEGKKIMYNYNSGNPFKIREAKVTGCNRAIGLTIQAGDCYCICLNGPSSPLRTVKNYNELFNFVLTCIDKGSFTPEDHKKFDKIHGITYSHYTSNPSAATCPFSQ